MAVARRSRLRRIIELVHRPLCPSPASPDLIRGLTRGSISPTPSRNRDAQTRSEAAYVGRPCIIRRSPFHNADPSGLAEASDWVTRLLSLVRRGLPLDGRRPFHGEIPRREPKLPRRPA